MLSVHLSSDNLRSLLIAQIWCWTLSPNTGTNLHLNINYVEESDCSEDENSMIMHVLPTYHGLPKVSIIGCLKMYQYC